MDLFRILAGCKALNGCERWLNPQEQRMLLMAVELVP